MAHVTTHLTHLSAIIAITVDVVSVRFDRPNDCPSQQKLIVPAESVYWQ